MSKLNAFGLARLERVVETRSFFDEAAGETVTLTLRYPSTSEQAKASESANDLIRDFITGDEVRAVAPFPAEGVQVSETLFRTSAMIEAMQCPENPADAYTALELCVLSDRVPLAWREIQPWVNSLYKGGADAWGKTSPAVATGSSAARHSSSPDSTL